MFEHVEKFEKEIALFYNAPYAVATDCCTHALELSIILTGISSITVPRHTYISVPFLAKKTNINLEWTDSHWTDFYHISEQIIDAAVLWQQNSYIANSYMCLSFQFKKHLSLGRGGAILCSSYDDYVALKKLSYDGRNPNTPWANQDIDSVGYHYYMTPETAILGSTKLPLAINTPPKKWSWRDYPDLTTNSVFVRSYE